MYDCEYCGALFWYKEMIGKVRNTTTPKYTLCCQDGQLMLPIFQRVPPAVDKIMDPNGGKESQKFRDKVRAYNSIFASIHFYGW